MAAESKKSRTLRRISAFSLTEILIGLALFVLLSGGLIASCTSLTERYADKYSDENIEREVKNLKSWLEYIMHSAIINRRDFTLTVSEMVPLNYLHAKWHGISKQENWSSDSYAVKSKSTEGQPYKKFDYMTQTFTSGLTLFFYIKKDGEWTLTDWRISVSPYEYIRNLQRGDISPLLTCKSGMFSHLPLD